MNIARNNDYWQALLHSHIDHGRECSWVEFKHNQADVQEIGQYVSALSNASALCDE